MFRAAQVPSHQSARVAAAEVFISDAADESTSAHVRSPRRRMATLRTLCRPATLLKPVPVNTVIKRRQIADAIIDRRLILTCDAHIRGSQFAVRGYRVAGIDDRAP
jgi:hypothetical protein